MSATVSLATCILSSANKPQQLLNAVHTITAHSLFWQIKLPTASVTVPQCRKRTESAVFVAR